MPSIPHKSNNSLARFSLVAFALVAAFTLLLSNALWGASNVQAAQDGAQKREPKPQHEEIIVDDDEVLKIDTDLVLVEVNVTDAEGKPVRGLRPEDFKLY